MSCRICRACFPNGMDMSWSGFSGFGFPISENASTRGQWETILKDVAGSRFWEEDWNFAPYIVEAFGGRGLELASMIPDKRPGCGGRRAGRPG